MIPLDQKRNKAIILAIALIVSCSRLFASTAREEKEKIEIVLASEIKWEALNPARGDRSPYAGTLWGDRNAAITPDTNSEVVCSFCSDGLVPTGFLAKFVDGFSSPPHIHNVTYRAVVISGLVHSTGSTFRVVTIEGQPKYLGEETVTLSPGSHFSSSGDMMHQVESHAQEESVFYVRSSGPYRIISDGMYGMNP